MTLLHTSLFNLEITNSVSTLSPKTSLNSGLGLRAPRFIIESLFQPPFASPHRSLALSLSVFVGCRARLDIHSRLAVRNTCSTQLYGRKDNLDRKSQSYH